MGTKAAAVQEEAKRVPKGAAVAAICVPRSRKTDADCPARATRVQTNETGPAGARKVQTDLHVDRPYETDIRFAVGISYIDLDFVDTQSEGRSVEFDDRAPCADEAGACGWRVMAGAHRT